ncbi:MAG TPA: amidohydrolase [Candidatus Limnocylindria bacterium]|nr:amidohydrolase [Candidatus Limnocylindria bacterium]
MRATTPEAPADLVLTNGRIYTGNAKLPWASAIAIREETIAAVAAPDADLKTFIGLKTRVIDLRGQFAMPGFNDAHVHLAGAGQQMLEVNLEGAASLSEFQQRIRIRLKDSKAGEWIMGRGWDHTLWPEKKFPTRQDLDAVSTNHPMIFGRVDGHVAIANSRALAIAGIGHTTPDPPAGHIERDPATGEPTGMLEEDAAMDLVYNRIPPHSVAQRRRALELAIEEAVKWGVTSLQDNSVDNKPDSDNFGWQNFLVLQQMQRERALKARVTEWLPFGASLARLEEMRRVGGYSGPGHPGDPWLKAGAVKAFLDGSLGSRTAAMLAPYSDAPETSGILRIEPKQLERMAIERDRAGFQLAFHAIGDRANRVALDVFAAVRAANGARDRRDRIEHAQIVAPSDLPRFRSLDVIASMQPSHLLDDERWATDRLGPERVKGAYAWHTMQQGGVHLAFGTDFPVESVNPLRGLYACVTRELPDGGPAGGWHPEERLTIDECIRDYNVGSAYAEFEEQRKGTLTPGMVADIVVFPTDITRMPAKDLLRTSVAMTIVGGRIVYEQH